MIRVVVVDDHPAIRAGLEGALRGEPGLVLVGSVESTQELWPALHRTRPDVVVLDYHMPSGDGVSACRLIKENATAPRVLIYTAFAGQLLELTAMVGGADGLIGKGAPARELFDAIRRVGRGERVFDQLEPATVQQAATQLDERETGIFGMLVDGMPEPEVAGALGIDRAELSARIDGIIRQITESGAPTPRPELNTHPR